MKVLRNLGKTLKARHFVSEQGLTVVPLEGFSKWRSTEAYAWLNNTFLDNAVKMYVVLDRDYRTEETIHDLRETLRASGIASHVWQRKELESYLLSPAAMARISGVSVDVIEQFIGEGIDALRTTVFARYLEERHELERSAKRHGVNVIEHYTTVFDNIWTDHSARLAMVPPKDLISFVSRRLQEIGAKAISPLALSSKLQYDEIPAEMRDLLFEIEQLLTGPLS